MLALHLVLCGRLGRHLSAPLDRAYDRSLLGSPATRVATVRPGALGALARLPADIGFVHLDDAGEQVAVLGLRHGLADLHRDPPRRVLVDLQIAGELECRQALLGVQHQHDRQKPLLKRQVRPVEDRADRHAEGCLAVVATVAVLALGGVVGPAIGADRLSVPAGGFKMRDATLLVGKPLENLYDVHGVRPLVGLFDL